MSNHLGFQIHPTHPFPFDLALQYLRTSPSTILEVVTDDTYRRAIRLNGRPVLLTVRHAPPSLLDVEIIGPSLTASDRPRAEEIVRQTFGTDVDLAPLKQIASVDSIFGNLVHACAGLRPVVIPDLFETIVWAMIGQQISVQFAAKCKRALVERFGPRLEVDGSVYLLFPTAEQLAEAREADLAALQFSRQKIRYTLNLAREIVEGRLDLEELRAQPPDEALQRLERLLGIGRWTAEYVLLRGMGHRDVIPAGDGGLRRIIGHAYGLGRLATEAEVRELGVNWAGWRGYAAFYWRFTLQQQGRRTRQPASPGR